jgi:hypothetical protein
MSRIPGLHRRRTLLMLGGAALAAAALGSLSLLPPSSPSARAEVGELVAPDFAARTDEVNLVMGTTSEEFYHLVRDPEGWVLTEKGRYPVRADRMQELLRAISTMRYARPMTRDPKKFDRIGLGDPAQGGTGALLEVGNGRGDSFLKLIVGYRDGTTYVRQPDDLQAWAVSGEPMPPLQRGARWLDIDVVAVPLARVREVDVRPASGPGYRLVPQDEQGTRFGLAPPHSTRRVIASFGPSITAGALSRFAPVDVAPEEEVAPERIEAEHITRTRDGLEIRLRAWRVGSRGWTAVSATALPGASQEAAAEADAINARATGWAFALSGNDWGALSAPLASLVE